MRTVGPSRAKPAWRRWKFDWLAPKKPGQYTLLVRANMPTGPPGRAVADRTLIPYANYPRLHSAADVERIAASSITVGTPRTKGDCNRTS
jgi:hypothetical protein